MVILVKRPIWERVVLLVSIIPIALLCNITRIAATAIVYAKFNRKVETAHDYAGYAMMVLALGLVMLELKIMSWLVVEEEAVGPQTLLRTSYGASPGPR
jgi:exosortase/archaeosortase family protein